MTSLSRRIYSHSSLNRRCHSEGSLMSWKILVFWIARKASRSLFLRAQHYSGVSSSVTFTRATELSYWSQSLGKLITPCSILVVNSSEFILTKITQFAARLQDIVSATQTSFRKSIIFRHSACLSFSDVTLPTPATHVVRLDASWRSKHRKNLPKALRAFSDRFEQRLVCRFRWSRKLSHS